MSTEAEAEAEAEAEIRFIVVLTTIGTEEEAVKLAQSLLERKLVACVNVVPSVRSLYWWNGKVEDDKEQLLLLKTRAELASTLTDAVVELHPYDVPELLCLPVVAGSDSYLAWLAENVSG